MQNIHMRTPTRRKAGAKASQKPKAHDLLEQPTPRPASQYYVLRRVVCAFAILLDMRLKRLLADTGGRASRRGSIRKAGPLRVRGALEEESQGAYATPTTNVDQCA